MVVHNRPPPPRSFHNSYFRQYSPHPISSKNEVIPTHCSCHKDPYRHTFRPSASGTDLALLLLPLTWHITRRYPLLQVNPYGQVVQRIVYFFCVCVYYPFLFSKLCFYFSLICSINSCDSCAHVRLLCANKCFLLTYLQ